MSEAHENEIKIVLRDPNALEDILDKMFREHQPNIRSQQIQQGYLDEHTRLRHTLEGDKAQYYLTHKQRLPDHQNLEIEAVIDAKVFDEAWPYTHERLNKRRFKLIYSTLLWDIDFYRWSRPYFALAEVEMPPGTKEYDMLPLIQPYIHFVVPGADRRFDARHLADETHVEAVALGFGLLKSQPP